MGNRLCPRLAIGRADLSACGKFALSAACVISHAAFAGVSVYNARPSRVHNDLCYPANGSLPMMNSSQLRQAFLDYFQSQGHAVVASSPLIPGNDPTLLFTNAGMVQFKDVFLGQDKRPYVRAASSQRCVRAGGKHNDLENVGYTARHHTFFEMLGNFSFGDYFKHDAIRYAWDFLTVTLGLPKEKLWVTVFHEDQEAEDIWINQIGVDPQRFSRMGEKSNFWSMGDTGPCGPCTEIFYDHGAHIWGGPPGSPDEDGDRYIEIWNLVFMQYNRSADGSMTPLPKPSVDTGMGLERISAILQGVHSNYDTDLFRPLIKAAAEVVGVTDLAHTSLKVIADHIRSCSFLICDGVIPSNEGRGYVLRRIIRRAIRHGHQLGMRDSFFHKLVAPLSAVMGLAYPELVKAQARVAEVLLGEEQQFARTLDNGMAMLGEAIATLQGAVIPGETVFKLYDTYGFPVDLTADIAREKGLSVDHEGFELAMEAQKKQARAASKFDAEEALAISLEGETSFEGYESLESSGSVLGLFKGGKPVSSLATGDQGVVLLDRTSFYAESGGQVGDQGFLLGQGIEFKVVDTRKQGKHFLHIGEVTQGALTQGASLRTVVTTALRRATMLNHSATHLMHAALREVLGEHVTQKGSLVTSDSLRFDFSHNKGMTPAEVETVETLVNEQILANAEVSRQEMGIDAAKAHGAMALFGEKYGDTVRVISMGNKEVGGISKVFSIELCGGTHVSRTGDIGLFRIVQEGGIAAGVRRIEAVTGTRALQKVRADEQTLDSIAAVVKASGDNVVEKVQQLLAANKALEKELQQLKGKLASAAGDELLAKVATVAGVKVLVSEVEGLDGKALRDTADQLRNKLGSGIVVLAQREPGKASLIVAVSQDLTSRVKAGDLVSALAVHVAGKGGGRADQAMAGGSNPDGLPLALAAVVPELTARLAIN
jgi:alanyl-tRNA synthetase